jgi:hypothetical protein
MCETARRHRSSLHQPDRLALTPLMSELDLFYFVAEREFKKFRRLKLSL